MATQRIGILTGGGDVPGLNSVIKEVTYRATENCCEVIGLRRGWEALTHVRLDDAEQQGPLHPAFDAREYPNHRSLRRHGSAQQPDQSRENVEASRIPQ